MAHRLFSKVFATKKRSNLRGETPPDAETFERGLEFEIPQEAGGQGDDKIVGRCYRMGGELIMILKDGTNTLVRSDKNAIPWYEPRTVVLENLARHGLAKPACSSSGFWYDAGRVPRAEHMAVQNKKPLGSPRHWMDQ